MFCPTRRADVFVISIYSHDWRKNNQPSICDKTKTDRLDWFQKEVPNADPISRNALEEHLHIFSNGLYNVKTGNLIYRNYCGMNTSHLHLPWMWKAPLMLKVPALPHHPGNLCYHLLWWTICWCYYHWWFRIIYCLVNESHIGPRNPAWTWKTISRRLGMVTDIKYVHFLC